MCAPTPPGPSGARRGFYRLTGHKWFMSAPMSDAFLVLAQAPEGLSCFLVPRFHADGSGNGFRFQRLKDKLGNRSNASSEVEFVGAIGELVGEPGAGVKTIMDMVTLTRLDCAVASSALMRAGLAEAVHHTRHRQVFGQPLIEQPLMQRVLADMALDVAAATALSFRLARSFDEAASTAARRRLPGDDAGRSNTGSARSRRRCSTRRWSASAATAMSRKRRSPAIIARRPSTRSGKAPAMSWRSTCCACLAVRPDLFDEVLAGIEGDLGAGGPGDYRRAQGGDAGRRVRRGLGPHPDRAAGAVGRRGRASHGWVPAALPTPSSRPGSPANGAPPTACSMPATMRA